MKNLFTKLSLALLVATPAVLGSQTQNSKTSGDDNKEQSQAPQVTADDNKESSQAPQVTARVRKGANVIVKKVRKDSDNQKGDSTPQGQNGGNDTQEKEDKQENEQAPSRLRQAFLNKYAYGVYGILGAAATGYVADRYFNDGKVFNFLGCYTKSACDKTYLSTAANKLKGGTNWVYNNAGLSWFGGKVSSFASETKKKVVDIGTPILTCLGLLNAGKQTVDNFSNNKKPGESEEAPQQNDSSNTSTQAPKKQPENGVFPGMQQTK